MNIHLYFLVTHSQHYKESMGKEKHYEMVSRVTSIFLLVVAKQCQQKHRRTCKNVWRVCKAERNSAHTSINISRRHMLLTLLASSYI